MANDNFDTNTSGFLRWLREHPGITVSRKIEIADLRDHNAGRGIGDGPSLPFVSILAEGPVVAVEDVEEDEGKPSFLNNAFLIRISIRDAILVWGDEDPPGPDSLPQFPPKRATLTPTSFRAVQHRPVRCSYLAKLEP